jgi:hypothetical protein
MKNPSHQARKAIIIYSLIITGGLIIFLIMAQPLGMQFDFGQNQNLRLIDVVLPTFIGYLTSAAHFLFNDQRGRDIRVQNEDLLKIMIHGPFIIFAVAVICLFYAHQWSNQVQPSADPRIDHMDFGTLSRYLSILLGLLAATVTIISANLFGAPPPPAQKDNDTPVPPTSNNATSDGV